MVDLFERDEDVVAWLTHAGFLECIVRPMGEAYPGLAILAKQLRENLRHLFAQRKAGECVETHILNSSLTAGWYRMELTEDADGNLAVTYRFAGQMPGRVLVPVAIAAAELLARGDFKLVRQCESVDCPFWFYDRTRSHSRRWCGKATCGHRRKIARPLPNALVSSSIS
jgi:predicted RNA-binding Zn ribbon-like protein